MSNFQIVVPNELPATPQNLPSPVLNPAELLELIRRQIEYYFSQENLSKDMFMRNNMSVDGHVSVAVIAEFARVKKLTTDPAQIFQALEGSTMVAVDENGIRSLRPLPVLAAAPSRSTVMIRDVASTVTVDDIKSLLEFEGCPRILSVDQSSSPGVWLIRLESDDDAASLQPNLASKRINGNPVKCRVYSVPPSPKQATSPFIPSAVSQQHQQAMMVYQQQQQQYYAMMQQAMQMQAMQQQQQQMMAISTSAAASDMNGSSSSSSPIIMSQAAVVSPSSLPVMTPPLQPPVQQPMRSKSSLIQYSNNDILSLGNDQGDELLDRDVLHKPLDALVLNPTSNKGLFRGRSASMDQASQVAFKQVFATTPQAATVIATMTTVQQQTTTSNQPPSPTGTTTNIKKTFSEAARSAVAK